MKNIFFEKLLNQLKKENLLPEIPENLPTPSINDVELYLSFYGNDACPHCITCSGPHRKEIMLPSDTKKIIDHIAQFSILQSLNRILKSGYFFSDTSKLKEKLDTRLCYPKKLDDTEIFQYADSIMGKADTSKWIINNNYLPLNFGRPAIRISGGEFYCWPRQIDGKILNENERLNYQQDLLQYIHKKLPQYDIWILTNGRFAETITQANKVIKKWAIPADTNAGKVRICLSVDVFHKTPKNKTTNNMLKYIWKAVAKYNLAAPYIYSIPNKKIFLSGRAFKNFDEGTINKNNKQIIVDSNSLIPSNGCNELKGFVCETPHGNLLVNNIVVLPSGHLAYCCVAVGDYGSFLNTPEKTLKNITQNPIARMLSSGEYAFKLLELACKMDSSIKTYGQSKEKIASGATCYQLLSGVRK